MIIDVFNHFIPQAYFNRMGEWLSGHPVLTAFPRLPPLYDLDARLRLLDEFDGLTQVLSLANPPIELLGPPSATPAIARLANDGLAETCRKHPERFPTFIASMPMNNVEACLAEIDRATRELGARGIQVFTNVAGKPLSAPEFRPIFRRMAELDLPVWIHPMRGPQAPDYASEQQSEDEIWFMFGWPYETTACMTRLIFSGLLDELPDLKIISHHYGGMIPFFAGKIKLGFAQIFFGAPDRNPVAEKAGLKQQPIAYFRKLYADTAVSGEGGATRCGLDFFGPERSLFATDAPFDAEQGRGLIRETIRAVRDLEISQEDRERIFWKNAKALLKL